MAPVTTINEEHHAQRLRHILDAQSDVLNALNAITKVHIDRNEECIEIRYDLYTDALLFSHRGKTLAPASHPKCHCYYMVFKDIEEIINTGNTGKFGHSAARTVMYPWTTTVHHRCTVHRPNTPPRSNSPSLPAYSPKHDQGSSSSSSSEVISGLPPSLISSTHVAFLHEEDLEDFESYQRQIDQQIHADKA
jgi:hypothetical protein